MSTNEQDISENISEPGSYAPISMGDFFKKIEDEKYGELDDDYKLKDEATYSEQITNFRKIHSDADQLFNKRDEAIDKYKEALRRNESNEHIRITYSRLMILTYYIKRLIIDFFEKSNEEQTKIDDHYQSWANTSSIK